MPDIKCQMCLRLFLELRVVPVFIVTGVTWRYTTCLRWKREFLSSHLCKPRNIPAWMTVPSCRFWASVSPSLVLELWKGKFPAKPGVCTQRMWLHDWAYDNQRLPCRNARTLWLTRCLASCCAAWDVTKQPQPTFAPKSSSRNWLLILVAHYWSNSSQRSPHKAITPVYTSKLTGDLFRALPSNLHYDYSIALSCNKGKLGRFTECSAWCFAGCFSLAGVLGVGPRHFNAHQLRTGPST